MKSQKFITMRLFTSILLLLFTITLSRGQQVRENYSADSESKKAPWIKSNGQGFENYFSISGDASEAQSHEIVPRQFDPAHGSYHGAASATYTSGDIATDHGTPEPDDFSDCPGNLTVSIPHQAIITGVDVYYEMTASGSGWMGDQRSRLVSTSTGGSAESSYHSGSGGDSGTYIYERTGLEIANNVEGGGDIAFQLHAFRIFGNPGDGCDTGLNKVDDGTWTVTVHYKAPLPFYDSFELDNLASDWQTYDYEDSGLVWTVNSAQSNNYEQSVRHTFSVSEETDGWLVSPAIEVNPGETPLLSLWYQMRDIGWYTYTGIWVSAGSGDPEDGDFVELHEFGDEVAGNTWHFFSQELQEYSGEKIYIAFVYQGIDGHVFYMDDFRVMNSYQASNPAYYNDLSQMLKSIDIEDSYHEQNYGMTTSFYRVGTWKDGYYYAATAFGQELQRINTDSTKVESLFEIGFTNGLAYDPYSGEMYSISGNTGNSVYFVDIGNEDLEELITVPDYLMLLDAAFDKEGDLYIIVRNSDTDELFLGQADISEALISEVGMMNGLPEYSGSILSLFYDYTHDKMFVQFNVDINEGELFTVDLQTAEVTPVAEAGETARFGVAVAHSLVSFELVDEQSNQAVEDAMVSVAQYNRASDTQGELMVALGYGNHGFTVEKEGYYSYAGSLELGKDPKQITVFLEPHPATVIVTAEISPSATAGQVSGTGEYNFGQSVTLNATANEGYAFVNWTDEDDNEVFPNASYTFTPDRDRHLVARFQSVTSVAEAGDESFEVFPNPAASVLNIHSHKVPSLLQIFDLTGKEVFRLDNPSLQEQINISSFDEGLFMVRLLFEDEVETRRVLIRP